MPRVSRRRNSGMQTTVSEKRFQVGIYVRISVEDERKKENDSIGTQKELVSEYIQMLDDAEIYKIYEDVNFSGTNFHRPAFEEMIEDAKSQKINCIAVKDLSRFGRNYLETGQYLEYVFPFLNVRFISINDRYDSFSNNSSDGLIVPIKNLMNEIYARDISKKVRSQFEIKRKKGDFCGSFAPYGYTKIENRLVIDTEAAPIVRQIFGWFLSGIGDQQIVKKLNAAGYLPPARYRYEKGIVKGEKYATAVYWHKSAVKRILTNPLYIGNMANGRYVRSMFDNSVDKNAVVVCENTHEPIISEDDFLKSEKVRAEKRNYYEKTMGKERGKLYTPNMLKGFVYCADCNTLMQRYKCIKAAGMVEYHYLCRTYEYLNKSGCTRKYLLEEKMYEILWKAISKQIELFIQLKHELQKNTLSKQRCKKSTEQKKELHKLQKRLDELLEIESGLYGDYVDKILSEREYLDIKQRCTLEDAIIKDKIDELISKEVSVNNILPANNAYFVVMSKFYNENHLSRELVVALVERIEVDSNEHITITFKYRDEMLNLFDMVYIEQLKAVVG